VTEANKRAEKAKVAALLAFADENEQALVALRGQVEELGGSPVA